MKFKDVLLALSSFPDPTSVSAVDNAVDVVAAIGANISAVVCAVQIRVPGSVLANVLLDVRGMAADATKKSLTCAEALLARFEEAAQKRGVFQERKLEHCRLSEVSDVLVASSRLRDLTIVPVSQSELFEPSYAEAIVFGSGRPTLVIPENRKRNGTFSVNTVVVAWDFSRPAARAVADALPILQKAKRVYAMTVMNEKAMDTKSSADELVKHLACHGVEIVVDMVDALGRPISEVFQTYVALREADILVMGAYGHSRFREFILGGATKSMICRPPLPVFLSH
jgi:nucleotide-binding universal stress UspA family protein